MNKLKQLETCGQSPLLDYLKRSQRLDGLALRLIDLRVQLQIGKEPVAAVAFGHGERLAGQWDQTAQAAPEERAL